MKNKNTILFTALILAVCMLFSACIFERPDSTEGTDELAAFVKEKGSFPNMQAADAAVIGEVYGIDLSGIEEYTLEASANTLLADEIGIFRLSDPDYSSTLSHILEARIASAARAAEHYSPEQYSILIKTQVKTRGLYVYYIVNAESETLTEQLTQRIPLN